MYFVLDMSLLECVMPPSIKDCRRSELGIFEGFILVLDMSLIGWRGVLEVPRHREERAPKTRAPAAISLAMV
jgi:hypothetical protein